MNERPELYGIVAVGKGNEIGFKGDMPWHLPEDLRRFKALTTGHPVIMGRATWESLPKRPLPGRRNIVLTRDTNYEASGAETARSLTEAIALCEGEETPFVIGGGQIYRESLPLLTRLYVTRVESEWPQADTFFPDFSGMTLASVSEQFVSAKGLSFRFEEYTWPVS